MTSAAVCSVGDELLAGEVVDTNAAFLAARLGQLGIEVRSIRTLGDARAPLVDALREVVGSHDVVLVGGGLGPTPDDRTREAVAEALGLALERRDELAATIADRFAQLGARMPPANLRQAEVPVGAIALDPVGTAPGFVVRAHGAVVAALPGVPWEARTMYDRLEPHLATLPGTQPAVTRSLTVVGLGESAVAERLAPVEATLPDDVALAYLAGGGVIRVKLTARAARREAAEGAVEPHLARVQQLLGDAVVAVDAGSLEQVLVQQLQRTGRTLAVAESATGGALAARVASVPGASQVLRGGMVAYTEDAKVALCGVDRALLAAHGPVSREVTEALAAGARERLGADLGVATTGVAGPTTQGGRDVGTTVWAVATEDEVRSWERWVPGDREAVCERLVTAALEAVRRTA